MQQTCKIPKHQTKQTPLKFYDNMYRRDDIMKTKIRGFHRPKTRHSSLENGQELLKINPQVELDLLLYFTSGRSRLRLLRCKIQYEFTGPARLLGRTKYTDGRLQAYENVLQSLMKLYRILQIFYRIDRNLYNLLYNQYNIFYRNIQNPIDFLVNVCYRK